MSLPGVRGSPRGAIVRRQGRRLRCLAESGEASVAVLLDPDHDLRGGGGPALSTLGLCESSGHSHTS